MRSGLPAICLLLTSLHTPNVFAQTPTPVDSLAVTASPSPVMLSVPAGEEIILELKDPINTKSTRKGAKVTLINTVDVLAFGRVVIPRGSIVHAAVAESKRPGRLFGKGRIRLAFDEVELSDGSRLPLSVALSRAGWRGSKGFTNQGVKGEGGNNLDADSIAHRAIEGAEIGALSTHKWKGAAEGAIAGAVLITMVMVLRRGPDLDLPPGMMFEIELTKPLDVPLATVEAAERASGIANIEEPPPLAAEIERPAAIEPIAAPEPASPPPVSEGAEPTSTPVATAGHPATQQQPSPAPATSPITVGTSGYVLKMDVNLVLVEATVRDSHGGIADGLTRDDFRILEDGVEQPVQYFSRDELPLAVALVIDRSGSIAPHLGELRRAALETLAQLKPEDQVALLAFAASPERLEYLTSDRPRIADAIATIRPGGGTNITDALYTAALYLGRAANHRRHAVILVSDNQETVRGFKRDKDVIRMALETETVIYSIQIGGTHSPRGLSQPAWVSGTSIVDKMTRETGGEIIDAGPDRSLSSAMALVISRLKKRYTLGYLGPNKKRDGAFHTIDVQLAGPYALQANQYTVYARRGYYAPMERVATRSHDKDNHP
jgi:Ca-activated chloride channel homolog